MSCLWIVLTAPIAKVEVGPGLGRWRRGLYPYALPCLDPLPPCCVDFFCLLSFSGTPVPWQRNSCITSYVTRVVPLTPQFNYKIFPKGTILICCFWFYSQETRAPEASVSSQPVLWALLGYSAWTGRPNFLCVF